MEFSVHGFPGQKQSHGLLRKYECVMKTNVFSFVFGGGGNFSGLAGVPALVLADRMFPPDLPMNCEDDAPTDPLQLSVLSVPTVAEPSPSARLCLVGGWGGLTLQLRHFRVKPADWDASPGMTREPLSGPLCPGSLCRQPLYPPAHAPWCPRASPPPQHQADRGPPCWTPSSGSTVSSGHSPNSSALPSARRHGH